MVREKIKASQVLNKMQNHVLGVCSCKQNKPCPVSGPSGAKLSIELLRQVIGAPPQDIQAEVNVNVKAQVQSIVARVGEARARTALEVLAPGLLNFLPEQELIEHDSETP